MKKGKRRNGSLSGKGAGKKAPAIIISLKKVCKVCKEEGHQAGFQGANYIDCPRKPCFLCKIPFSCGYILHVRLKGVLGMQQPDMFRHVRYMSENSY
ncbi:hypothetical protein KFK09_017084 [Dendrobium nobile]|uniref:Uncharacterized protein n=1 Tax=Dendrobium nobile TaxID=94219 RepID=A0A8T3B179_DENNO|nr:hypothetical protein KFK09_017084 [Dendrobium nobile]